MSGKIGNPVSAFLFRLGGRTLEAAHQPWAMNSGWHDRLEFLAYRVIDPLAWALL